MPRQVEGDDAPAFGQDRQVEHPTVDVAAKAVHQHERHDVRVAQAQIVDRPAIDRGGLRLRPLRRGYGRGHGETGLKLLDEGIDLGLAHRGLGDNREQATDRHRRPFVRGAPAQGAANRAL